ncbi:protein ATAF2-like [Typha angustifolia]|uniref:protein ATAF2-like n=1 Tax=Typha angustifolia TaxID=59011 RepID=UPI003C2EDE30
MAAAKRTLRLTPGIQFCPTDSELVGHYLCKKLCGEKLPDGVRPEIDLYCAHPDRLTGTKLPKITPFFQEEGEKLNSIPRIDSPSGTPSRLRRTGSTSPASDCRRGKPANGFEGTKQRFAYLVKVKGEKEEKPTNWVMDEYTIKNDSSGSAEDPKTATINSYLDSNRCAVTELISLFV